MQNALCNPSSFAPRVEGICRARVEDYFVVVVVVALF